MTEEDDAGASFFFRRENAVVIGVEQSNDAIEGLLPMAIFKDADIGALGTVRWICCASLTGPW